MHNYGLKTKMIPNNLIYFLLVIMFSFVDVKFRKAKFIKLKLDLKCEI